MNDVQVAVRVPAELVERIDAYKAGMLESNPGLRLSRSDVIRLLLNESLDGKPVKRKGKA